MPTSHTGLTAREHVFSPSYANRLASISVRCALINAAPLIHQIEVYYRPDEYKLIVSSRDGLPRDRLTQCLRYN